MSTPTTLFADILARFEATGADSEVTQYLLTLGAANATTGCYAESFSAGTTIHMPIFSRTSQFLIIGTGFHVRKSHLGFTETAVMEGDKILDANSFYYKVTAVRPHYWGDVLVFYEADLEYNLFNF